MRAGGCTVQQALTAEAATVVKQSVNLAKRRGHAQVTPLHVASMMLSSASLLRAACLQSHSHPLQCKALELCFNVALNRLPTSSTILAAHASPHHHYPTLSNALIAAFKRAQAHQRRGGVECQQQPLLAVKIELGQLIISILDDPSVSRVMREAGFSSTQVKIHVETAVMVEASSAPDKSTNSTSGNKSKDANFAHGNKVMSHVRSEDVTRVLDCFSSGNKRSVIVVGECVSLSQGVIKVVMDKIAKGEVQEDLRNTQLIPLPLSSSNIMTRDEVDSKVVELKSLVKSCCLGRRGALFVIEDFKWACEVWQFICQEKQIRGCTNYTYSPVEHMIMEISSLIKSTSCERVWLLGFCSSSSYMSCKQGEPSLETLWCLHSIAVTDAGGLGLSLCESDIQIQRKSNGCSENGSCRWSFTEGIHGNHTDRSVECRRNDQTDIPVWLQHNTKERNTGSNIQGPLEQNGLRLMNWNTVNDASFDSRNLNSSSELTLSFSNTLCRPSLHTNSTTLHCDTRRPWPFSLEKEKSCRGRGGHFWQTETNVVHGQCTVSLHNSNPNSNTNSSVSDETSNKEDYRPRFKELNAENLKILCNALESKVPWQKAIIPEIASAILQCRSGMKRRKGCRGPSGIREDTWFLFHGVDNEGKENVAREIASLVFGSQSQFLSMRLGMFVPTTRCTSPDNTRTKRSRIEHEDDYLEQVFRFLHQNTRRVIFIKDIDRLDYNRKMRLARAIRDGVIRNADGEEVRFHDSIVILSCDALFLRSHSSSPHANINKVDHEEHVEVANAKEPAPGFGLDLNLCVNDNIEECSFDDLGLLEVVDQVFWFKLQEII